MAYLDDAFEDVEELLARWSRYPDARMVGIHIRIHLLETCGMTCHVLRLAGCQLFGREHVTERHRTVRYTDITGDFAAQHDGCEVHRPFKCELGQCCEVIPQDPGIAAAYRVPQILVG